MESDTQSTARKDRNVLAPPANESPQLQASVAVAKGSVRPAETGGRNTAIGTGSPAAAPASPPALSPRRQSWTGRTFLAVVLAPTLITWLYVAFFAASQFETETRFVVRGSLETIAPTIGIPGAGANLAMVAQQNNSQEAHAIADYIRSRAIILAIDRELNLRTLFAVSYRDPVFGVAADVSTDGLVAFWNRQVHVSIEALSGVVTLDVRAFSPADAVTLSRAILRHAEVVANDISLRGRRAELEQALQEWRQAGSELHAVAADLQRFRNASGAINPTQKATSAFAAIAQLRDERSALGTDLATALAQMKEDSPVVRSLRERLRSLDDKIGALEIDLFGASNINDGGTTRALSEAATLESRRKLAEDRFRASEAALETARSELARRNVYIVVFAPPTPAGESGYPLPSLFTAGVFSVLLAVWSIGALYINGVRQRTR